MLGGVQRQPPLPEGLHHLEGEGAERHLHAIGGAPRVRPHRGVAPAHVDDGVRLRRAEVGVEREADHHEQVADLVLAGEPDALVRLRVRRPHDAHRIGRVVDEELVEAGEGRMLAGGRVRGGAGCRAAPDSGGVLTRRRSTCARGRPAARSRGLAAAVATGGGRLSYWVRTALTVRSDRVRGPAGPHRPTGCHLLRPGRLLRRAGAAARRGPRARVRTRLLGDHPLRGHPEPQPRPGPLLLGTGCAGQRPAANERGADGGPLDPPHGSARARRLPRPGQPAVHAPGAVGPGRVDPQERLDAARRGRRPRGDRLRRRAGGPLPPGRDRRAPRHRRVGPGGLPRLVRRGDRVTRSASRRDHGRPRRALGFHRRSTSGPSATTRGRTWCPCWSGARSAAAR